MIAIKKSLSIKAATLSGGKIEVIVYDTVKNTQTSMTFYFQNLKDAKNIYDDFCKKHNLV